MKKAVFFLLLLALEETSYSQQTDKSKTLNTNDFLVKSRNEKIAGKIFLGGGAALILTGFAVGLSDFHHTLSAVLLVTGVVSMGTGITLLRASTRNKRIATSGIGYFKFENTQSIQKMGIAFQSHPAISIRINLR